MKRPPKPKGSFLLGHYKQFKQNPIKLLLDASENQGDIFTFKVLNKTIYFVNHPDYIEYVLKTNQKNFIKTPATPLRMIVGDGIFTSDGDEWLKRRKLYQPALNNTSIRSYTSAVIENTNNMLAEMEGTEEVNFSVEMTKITIAIISETLFSTTVDFKNEMWDNIETILKWVGERRLRHPFVVPAQWKTKKNKVFHQAVANMDEVIYKIIKDRQNSTEEHDDLLSRFMNPTDDLPKLNPKELRDEVMTIFLAGHETSANVLSWTFYMLGMHPEIQEKVFNEVDALGDKELSFEDLKSLMYTSQVLNETMRLYPPVWHFGRVNLEEDKIGDYVIPKGSAVRISPMAIQRRTKYWDNPELFDPERFSLENSKTHIPYTNIPFGGGPRLCAGRNFAMMEMLLIVAKTVRAYKLVHEGKAIAMAPLLTLRPQTDVILKVQKR